MMTFETDDETGVMEFTVDGGVTRAEYDAAVPMMEAVIARYGKLNGVALVRSFSGMELGAWWKDISWGVGHLSKIGRVALVTDIGWLEAASKVATIFYPGELKLFSLAEVEAARAWARG